MNVYSGKLWSAKGSGIKDQRIIALQPESGTTIRVSTGKVFDAFKSPRSRRINIRLVFVGERQTFRFVSFQNNSIRFTTFAEEFRGEAKKSLIERSTLDLGHDSNRARTTANAHAKFPY